jgi:hypothetical protein
MKRWKDCNRQGPSYICDPDRVIVPVEADQLNAVLANIVNETNCPCSRYSCSLHPEGYKIGIALVRKIRPDEEFHLRPDDERDANAQHVDWKLNEGKLFAHELRQKWQMGRCDEDVLIFFSLHDGVLYTAVGDVARLKLNYDLIRAISMNARRDFGPGGNIFRGLLQIVKEYRTVFFGTYHAASSRPLAARYSSSHSMEFPARNTSRLSAALMACLVLAIIGLRFS